jgi:RimJ/RimL family protein N-acetyltransferase
LRDVQEADLPVFFEHQLDPEATRMAGFPARDREPFMAHWHGILQDESVVKKTVIFEGEVAGNVVSFVHSGEREVGYWIGKKHWDRSVATRALAEFLLLEARLSMLASPVTTSPLSGFWRTAGSGSRARSRKNSSSS